MALVEMGKAPEACEEFARAIEIGPRDAAAYYDWGVVLDETGSKAEAIEKLEKAAELDPARKPKVEELLKELKGKK